MIWFNEKTQQDFLSKKWIERIQRVSGKEITDNKYCLVCIDGTWYVDQKDVVLEKQKLESSSGITEILPTYTLSELLYKLPEWPGEYKGLSFFKDAPFYSFGYYGGKDKETTAEKRKYIVEMPCTYPIESAASLLIFCYGNEEIRPWIVDDVSDK